MRQDDFEHEVDSTSSCLLATTSRAYRRPMRTPGRVNVLPATHRVEQCRTKR